jgi:lysophospholipase L1-like esterase
MKKNNFYRAFLIALASLFSLLGCSAIESIFHKKIFVSIDKLDYLVSGRYEKSKEYISFSCSGVNLAFLQPEEAFSVWIEDMALDSLNGNWMNIIIADTVYERIQLMRGKQTYRISVPSNTGKVIILSKATEAFVGEVKIYGIEVLNELPRQAFGIQQKMNIQFIGNSITCGYGNMVSIPAPPAGNPLTGFHTVNQNAQNSYAMITARSLKAIPMLVSFSGKGMYRNFDSDTIETIPKIYDRIHLQNKNSKTWDHTQQVPDIIVINLGTNDYYGESRNQPLNDSVFVQTYIQFVERLFSYYPKAKIICVNGPMLNDTWPEGKKCWTRVQASIQKVQEHFQAKGNRNVYRYFFTPQSAPYGEDYHPSLATHTKMAEELTTFIQTVVNK